MSYTSVVKYILVFSVFIEMGTALRIGCVTLEETSKHQVREGVNETNLVTFRLFTRKNPYDYQELRINDTEALINSNYNKSLFTRIYAPGWGDNGGSAHPIRDEYLFRDDCNFFTVFWVDVIANVVDAPGVVQATKIAGDYTGAFIDFLIENGATLNSFHVIGHSAGAHVAGNAGAAVTSGKIHRVTSLDPADGGVWSLSDPSTCTEKSDAQFVDVVHTNGGEVENGEIAFDEPMGHADFYVNGGQIQPNCPVPDEVCCSHCRTIDLFRESINTPVGFWSVRCESYEAYLNGTCDGNYEELMGDTTTVKARGKFYVDTNDNPPWAKGKKEMSNKQ